MAASTITVKFSPREYANYRRWLEELREAKLAKAKRSEPITADPPDPKTRHELNVDAMELKRILDAT